MNNTMNITWFDDVDLRSCYLAADYYGVQVEKFKKINKNEANVIFTGEDDKIKILQEDFESGDVMPMCGKRDMDDDEYDAWLLDSVKSI